MKSVRLTLHITSEQQCLIDCSAEFDSGGGAAPEMSYGDNITNGSARYQKMPLTSESDVHHAAAVTKIGDALKKNEGSISNVCNSDFCHRDWRGFQGVLTHSVLSVASTR
jgi:hypothetical protein